MTTPENIINDVLAWLVDRTKADSYFAGVAVMHEDDSDFLTKTEQALAAAGGTAIIWLGPRGNDTRPGVTLGPLDILLTATVHQNPVLPDGKFKPARAYARRLISLFKNTSMIGFTTAIQPTDRCLEPADSDIAPVAYAVNLKCREANEGQIRVDIPRFTYAASPTPSLAIATATDNAEIRYTIDNTYPKPDSALYTGPLTEIPTICRAAAYLANAIPSPENVWQPS